MKQEWEKRYTFRLTEEERELGEFLESIGNSKKSEVIRNLLLYSFAQMKADEAQQHEIQSLRQEINELREQTQKNHEQLMEMLKQGYSPIPNKQAEEKEEENKVSSEAIRATAMAFLGGF